MGHMAASTPVLIALGRPSFRRRPRFRPATSIVLGSGGAGFPFARTVREFPGLR